MGNITISNASLNKELTWSVLNLKFAISNINVTRKMSSEELKKHNFITMCPILNQRNLLFYYRLLPDSRILFGARGDLKGSKESSLKMSKWIEKRLKGIK